jgi:hypothetical protein
MDPDSEVWIRIQRYGSGFRGMDPDSDPDPSTSPPHHATVRCNILVENVSVQISVADPDGPPGSGSISQMYGSGSFYQAETPCFLLLVTFF